MLINDILELPKLSYLSELIKRYPEIHMLLGKVETSPEHVPRLKEDSLIYQLINRGDIDTSAIEIERTFLSLLLFKEVLQKDCSLFPKLSKSAFNETLL